MVGFNILARLVTKILQGVFLLVLLGVGGIEGARLRRGYDPRAAVHDAEAQQMAWLAGAALPAQHVAAAQQAYRADQAKTAQTLVNAEALKAISAIGALDQAAQYSFSGGSSYG